MKDVAAMTVQELRDGGYSVAIFTPDELRGAEPDEVADIMIERGWNAIDTLGTT
jgi:hypothetical protein